MFISPTAIRARMLQSQNTDVGTTNVDLRARVAALESQVSQYAFANGQLSAQLPAQMATPWSYMPQPSMDLSSAPAGKGLGSAPEFGDNAIRTAGGYTIVPEGKDQAWDIYAPGQKPGDVPETKVWGDPHVEEKDGTHWDFSQSSNFRLPDGTNIAVGTTAEDGHSLTSTLDITNGADRIQVSGIDQNKPVVGNVTHDGYFARANQAAEDTFTLGGDSSGKVQWFKQDPAGRLQGEVTGADFVDGSYQQHVDANAQYVVDPSLRPAIGTPAWGNMLRDQALDLTRNVYGSGSAATNFVGGQIDESHQENTWQGRFQGFTQQLSMMMGMYSMWNLASQGRQFGNVQAY